MTILPHAAAPAKRGNGGQAHRAGRDESGPRPASRVLPAGRREDCSGPWGGHPHGMDTGRPSVHGPCVAADVHYLGPGGARAAAVVAADAAFSRVVAERTVVVAEVAGYRPGEFYQRELPPLRAVLHEVAGLGLLVVDGYADLDPGGRPGLGAHAHREFAVPVIGVAKSAFRTATHAIPVLRGTSARPVFVTAAGMPRAEAAELVRRMAGRFRIPDALRRADQLARTGAPAAIRGATD